jgi:NAD(P)H-dependent FMN reductase
MNLLVISASLNPESKSRLLADAASATLTADHVAHERLDLRDLPLPLCDGSAAYGHPNVAKAAALVSTANAIMVAAPIYNYDVNAALKNFLELTGKAWTDKTVSFLVAAGGHASYMSIMGLANSLMLDFRCLIVPRFVYAAPADFSEIGIASEQVTARIAECARATAQLARQRSTG